MSNVIDLQTRKPFLQINTLVRMAQRYLLFVDDIGSVYLESRARFLENDRPDFLFVLLGEWSLVVAWCYHRDYTVLSQMLLILCGIAGPMSLWYAFSGFKSREKAKLEMAEMEAMSFDGWFGS